MGSVAKYLLYEGETFVGTYTGRQAEQEFGCGRYTLAKCARDKWKLRGKYTVLYADGRDKKESTRADIRPEWKEEWKAATAVIREEIEVEKLIRKSWDKAVKPFRRRSWMWKENNRREARKR